MAASPNAREILTAANGGNKLDKDIVAVRMGTAIFDLHTPLPSGTEASALTIIRADQPEGLRIVRHSTAHVMADAVQKLFPGTKVTIGPAIDDGFFYDFKKPEGTFTEDDLAKIEKAMMQIVKADSRFRREEVTREAALALFDKMGESFKVEIIQGIPAGEPITLYRHGRDADEWFDVCAGPHVPSTGLLKAVKLTAVAGAYWRGDEKNPMLQRIYGTAFPSVAALEEHLKLIEEAKQRDHRKVGKELDLFMFHEFAPAMPFFLPKGTFVYNKLVNFIRDLYVRYGYEEVITPQAFAPELFRRSGHLGHYNDNMFRLWTEDQFDPQGQLANNVTAKLVGPQGEANSASDAVRGELNQEAFALKPMNCPSHCLIFGSKLRSYRELPWRVADFGRLHRYERGGVVHGLARVRSFCQDDAHIFCTDDQVPGEIEKFIRFLYEVYNALGFSSIDIKLATRPESRIGSDEMWDRAEKALQVGLEQAGLAFEITPGEGAFYGPKVEFHIKDALKRSWQLGTIQYDPNLPERFDLSYVGSDGKDHRPIMLHRAILGSLERFFAVYLEHCAGNFPTWLAPRQAILLTVATDFDGYAKDVAAKLEAAGIRVDVDLSRDKLGAKIRNARLARYPYLAVVGAKEAETNAVGVRSRERGELGAIAVDEWLAMLLKEASPPTAVNPS